MSIKKVSIIKIEENKNPKFIKTHLIKAKREGEKKEFFWEMTKNNDSVHILIDNIETEELIFVKQVRIPVLFNDNSKNGIVIEACAGIVDKDTSLFQIAKEEIEEECGYCPSIENIKFLKKLKSSVGMSGSNSFAFSVEVTEDMKISEGGGLESEDIEVIRVKYSKLNDFFNSDIHTDAITLYLLNDWKIKQIEKLIKR